MIHFLTGPALGNHRLLISTMHQDRRAQFIERNKWGLQAKASGEERDQYDHERTLYLIWKRDNGVRGGSLRFLPTTGLTMLGEHFSDVAVGAPIGEDVWECTRICRSPPAPPYVSLALDLAAVDLGLLIGLSAFVGVFDAKMG